MDDDEAALIAAAEQERSDDDAAQIEPPEEELQSTTKRANERPSNGAEKWKQSKLAFDQKQPNDYLPDLNAAQREAVVADLGSLQILAGPGSGKTKVLTTRVAYLLQHYNIDPKDLVVVTFTNKAANEMKTRLSSLIGPEMVSNIVMGTFHSVCVRYLRRYGKRIGVKNDFTVADRDDCLAIAKRALVSAQVPDPLRKELKPNFILDVISKCKANSVSPSEYRAQSDNVDYFKAREKTDALADIYQHYEDELARDNALDFDDLLVRGLELVRKNPGIVHNIKSVLIDEFQDTNSCQYSLVKLIAKSSQSLTIVGDPDQSIYGWRNAEVGNLEKMVEDFEGVKQVFLEENYRSTGSILGAALAVVRQDTTRINKGLKATHGAGSSVVLHCAPNAYEESAFIAAQIKHLIAHTGNLVDHGDVAILLRYGALSRNIEVALQKAGIPSRMVGGHKFFDRAEVKDMISYLQLVDNPSYTAAFTRVVNTPTRGVGEKTVRDIITSARESKISAFDMCKRMVKSDGKGGLATKQKNGIKVFIQVIEDLQRRAEEGTSVPDLIDFLTTQINYEAHLEKAQGPDAKDRWENIKELKAFAAVVAEENPDGVADIALPEDDDFEEVAIPLTDAQSPAMDEDDDVIIMDPPEDGKPAPAVERGGTTESPLRTFLAVSMLATDSETDDSKADSTQGKVTISTCHAAKGLEWPIVFVPACEDGTYPFYRCTTPEEVAEERRLLYVAITRAQAFCTLTHSQQRMSGAEMRDKTITPFLAQVSTKYPTLFVPKLQKITTATREAMAKVLHRPVPDGEVTKALIEEHAKTLPHEEPNSSPNTYNSRGVYASQINRYSSGSQNNSSAYSGSRTFPFGSSSSQARAAPLNAGFNSALSSYRGAGSTSTPFNGTGRSLSEVSTSSSSLGSKVSKPLPMTNSTRPSSGAFKPPRPSQPGSSSANGKGKGVVPPETRSSLISNPILVGYNAEWVSSTVPRNLVERFEKAEKGRLDEMRGLANEGSNASEGGGKRRKIE